MMLVTCALALIASFGHPIPRPDSVHIRRVSLDTVMGIVVASDVASDRRIRLSVSGDSIGTPFTTVWMNADTVQRWLAVIDAVRNAHEIRILGTSLACHKEASSPGFADSVVGHMYVVSSAVALTPLIVSPVPIYKIDIADSSAEHTATLGATTDNADDLLRVLRRAADAAHLLRDDELWRTGPLHINSVQSFPFTHPPPYPESLRARGIQGEVVAQFVVDTMGRADMTTFRVTRSSAPAFTQSVRRGTSQERFQAATIEGHVIRQCVVRPFTFTLH